MGDSNPRPAGDSETVTDAAWFDANPGRRYRARAASNGQVWLVRKRGRVFLRTLAPLPRIPTLEREIEARWFSAAWPDLTPHERAALVRESLRNKKKGTDGGAP
jgi:hypothetical protein